MGEVSVSDLPTAARGGAPAGAVSDLLVPPSDHVVGFGSTLVLARSESGPTGSLIETVVMTGSIP